MGLRHNTQCEPNIAQSGLFSYSPAKAAPVHTSSKAGPKRRPKTWPASLHTRMAQHRLGLLMSRGPAAIPPQAYMALAPTTRELAHTSHAEASCRPAPCAQTRDNRSPNRCGLLTHLAQGLPSGPIPAGAPSSLVAPDSQRHGPTPCSSLHPIVDMPAQGQTDCQATLPSCKGPSPP